MKSELKVFLSEAKKVLLPSIVVVTVSFGLSYFVLQMNWTDKPKWLTKVISGVLSVLAEALFLIFHRHFERARSLEEEKSTLEGKKEEYRVKLEELRQTCDWQKQRIGDWQQVLGHNLFDWKAFLPNPIVREMHKRYLERPKLLVQLLDTGTVDATYRHQFELAEYIAGTAEKYLWATSLDRMSEFQRRNLFYLETLKELRNSLPSSVPGQVPVVARIFVGEQADFFVQLRSKGEGVSAVDLYEWHLRWNRGNLESCPVRFFLYMNDQQYHALFEQCELRGSNQIDDFIIVDGKLVYGWQKRRFSDVVTLRLYHDTQTVEKYKQLYELLWSQSIHLKSLSQLITNGRETPGLDDFLDQCHKRESKLKIEQDYLNHFQTWQRRGNAFFIQVCDLISRSSDACFALDRADLKGIDLVEAWKRPEYSGFKEATKAVARNGSKVRRLFVIQNALGRDAAEVRNFINDFIDSSGMELGFIFANEVDLPPLRTTFETDFIVAGYHDQNPPNFEGAIGFELENRPFEIESLVWTENLIARERMPTHFEIFEKLWESHNTTQVHPHDRSSLERAVEKLTQETPR